MRAHVASPRLLRCLILQGCALCAAILPVAAENIAPAGTAILGVNDAVDSDIGTPHANAGATTSINDGDPVTRVDTWFGGNADGVSYVGIVWPAVRYDSIQTLTLTLATFGDGGWFGNNGSTPTPGDPLDEGLDLVEPSVQVTTDGGTNWTTVADTSDYITAFSGHPIGGGTQPNPTTGTAVFTLSAPATGINGIRIIGQNGGLAGDDANGFLGVIELEIESAPSADTDGDGMGDSWEMAYGLNVGTDDSAGDPDNDGLTNLQEFNAQTDPTKVDTDGDSLSDSAEVQTHHTSPLLADTDGDGLDDGREVNDAHTDPNSVDTDGDSLRDGDEVLTYHSNPLRRDSDADSFSDDLEVALGSDPADPTDFPSNIAPTGTGIMGVNDAIDGDNGTVRLHAGVAASINDGDPSTRIDNWFGDSGTDNGQNYSYVGVVWPAPRPGVITGLKLTLATFVDGGWFGTSETGPGAGGLLTGDDLIEPTIQVSMDNGTNWTTVVSTSDYLTALDGHGIGGGENPNPSSVTASFTLTEPASGVTGVRIIGENGGAAGADPNGFIGVFELEVDAGLSADTDSDGLDDTWETAHGLNVGVNDAVEDPDSDGLQNIQEFASGTDPKVADTDGDGLNDGAELTTANSDPTNPDTDGDGLTDGQEVNTSHTDPADPDSDDDGLTDGDEVNTRHTDPNLADSDGDQFPDAIEIALGSDPTLATSVPANIASLGTAILGTDDLVDGDAGTALFNAGALANINDANPTTRVDTYNGGGTDTASFVGILWDMPPPKAVVKVELTLATFFDGGWFGVGGSGPGSGGVLNPTDYLVEPTVQVTQDGGDTWTDVAATSDYLQVLDGHPLPDVDFGPPTSVKASFDLSQPQTGIDGIRVVGTEGGTASGGFLGVFELAVLTETTGGGGGDDTDGDGLTDAEETGTYGTDPTKADTDGDGISDGEEVQVTGTDPKVAASTFRILSIDPGIGGEWSATWSSTAGKTYQVEVSTDLKTWTTAQASLPAAGAPATSTSTALPADPSAYRFVRVSVVP